jgi:deoxyribose-phosphate aldolase
VEQVELKRLAAEIGEVILKRMAGGEAALAPAVAKEPQKWTPQAVAAMIDHTILRGDATEADVRKLCAEAAEHRFASVCVNAWWAAVAAAELRGTGVKVCTVAGFPLGMTPSKVKAEEAAQAVRVGAGEVDMVMAVGALKSGQFAQVRADVAAVAEACHQGGAILKVIIEACLLTKDEKETACKLSVEAGADFVKTSTGFSKYGATVEDVDLMRRVVGPSVGVKAAGGIRTLEDFEAMVRAGASRVGASASVKIVETARG